MEHSNKCSTSYEQREFCSKWTYIKPDSSQITQNQREIRKTVQDYGYRLIHLPMKIEQLNQKMDEILQILPDLKNSIVDLKKEVSDLGEKRKGQKGISNNDRIRDAFGPVPLLHKKEKATEIMRPKTQEEKINEILSRIN